MYERGEKKRAILGPLFTSVLLQNYFFGGMPLWVYECAHSRYCGAWVNLVHLDTRLLALDVSGHFFFGVGHGLLDVARLAPAVRPDCDVGSHMCLRLFQEEPPLVPNPIISNRDFLVS